jgi:hypothetical protein
MVDESSMDGTNVSGSQSFSDRVLRLREKVEHRVATNPADREAAFRLRFEAYQKIGFLQDGAGERLYDPRFDDAPNALITTTWIDGELAGTVRVNIGVGENAVFPVCECSQTFSSRYCLLGKSSPNSPVSPRDCRCRGFIRNWPTS